MDPERRVRLRLALLCVALAAIAIINMHPQWDIRDGGEPGYPVHLDEYVHWGRAANVTATGDVSLGDPFTGQTAKSFSVGRDLHERGFHVFLSTVHSVMGIEWLPIFQYLPMLVSMFLGLCAYVLAERWDAGVEAALFVAAIPTTLRFLGPGIVVPIAFSMPFILLGIWLLFEEDDIKNVIGFLIIAAAGWTIHSMAGLAFTVLGGLYMLTHLLKPTLRSAGVVAVVAVLAVLAWPAYKKHVLSFLRIPTLPVSPEFFSIIGVLPMVLAAFGVWILVRSRATLAIGSTLAICWLACAIIFMIRIFGGRDAFGLFDRTHLTIFVVTAILAGVGLAGLRRWILRAPQLRLPAIRGAALAIVLITSGAAVASAAGRQMAVDNYFTVLTDEDYEIYLRASAIDLPPGKAIVDGFGTMAFTALTGKPTHAPVLPTGSGPPPAVLTFFEEGASNTAFLKRAGISLVVTPRPVSNPDLVELTPGVYALAR